ncbi:FHA domain-containing protein [Clostridium thermarum]|uniref:FHA domain-containing protein n=1 Tax=Clostridium thermarum TaxID=1716543 RepID=UPI001FADE698|nr:FHA domain-containing protein [Clostridium thermarum]
MRDESNKLRHILSIQYHENVVSTIELEQFGKEKLSFGRGQDNDIVLKSSIVSNQHGFIVFKDGRCIIEDNQSTNGIIINQQKVIKAELKNGDIIRIDDLVNRNSEGISMVYTVIHGEGNQKWRNYFIDETQSITIGRTDDNTIAIKHSSVSRKHAEIFRRKSGFYLKDLGSTNGTFLNGEAIGSEKELKEGDVIFIGNTKFIFYNDKLVYEVITKGLSIEAIGIGKVVKENRGMFKGKAEKRLLDDINISIKPGELVALVGGSGAGKSTFMDTLNGFRRATMGTVLVNDDDFYNNYNAYKNILGYVPQQDIVYDNLNVEEMLTYSAQLRMPKDATMDEIKSRVAEVIKDVELEGRETVVIKNLSGGQKKRVSIAVELLADPQLFFLDEPTSGLDPGMERNMMQLLRKLADKGKTVILITHAMANLHLCDKVTFLGRGGKLCYFGPPKGALDFFNINDFVDIYDLITYEPDQWCDRFKKSNYYIYSKPLKNKSSIKKKHNKIKGQSGLRQFRVLWRRYFKLTVVDRQRLLLLLLQAPIVALLLAIVTKKNAFSIYESTSQILFTLSCAAVWIGVLNSIQEVCKERVIFKRERAVNLKLMPYIGSKLLILGVICIIQSVIMIMVFDLIIKFPTDYHLVWSVRFELIVTTFLTLFASAAMGIAISTLVTNSDRAMSIAPFLLIPQIIFSGFIFKLSGISEKLSAIFVSKWSLRAMAESLNINSLPLKMIEENKDNPQILAALNQMGREVIRAYDHDINLLYRNWIILGVTAVICVAISLISLKINTDK